MRTTHPRTKSSEGYPEAYNRKDFISSDRFNGASWESLLVDLSEPEERQVRCFGTMDDMSSWAPKLKYVIAEGDTYTKWPSNETYPQLEVNYIQLATVSAYNQTRAPVIDQRLAGNLFGAAGKFPSITGAWKGQTGKAFARPALNSPRSARVCGTGVERRGPYGAQEDQLDPHASPWDKEFQDSF